MAKINVRLLNDRPSDYEGLWLSVSRVKTFQNCPAQYKYAHIEKLPKKDWEHLKFGKFAHEILELFHKYRIGGNKNPDHKLMTTCFKKASKKYDIKKNSKQEVYEALNVYLAKLAKQREDNTSPQVIGVEERFYIDINGIVLINGFIDKVQVDYDDVMHVKDYKTSKSKTYLKKDWFQLETYALAKFLEYPDMDTIRVSYDLLRHNFEELEKEVTRKDALKVIETYVNYANKISKENKWEPNPNKLCEYCSFIEKCEPGREFFVKDKDLNYGMIDWI